MHRFMLSLAFVPFLSLAVLLGLAGTVKGCVLAVLCAEDVWTRVR
jgi:ABC-type lipoprotein release transport system permease subunit